MVDFIKPKRFKKMLEDGEQVFAPCVWDGFSARAVEMAGFNGMLLSGGALSMSMRGLPDLGIISRDEEVWATQRITSAFSLPLIIDAEDGFGEGPMNAYHTAEQLYKAGAQGLTIEDTCGIRGWDRVLASNKRGNVVPVDQWLAKIKAAKKALEGTDCVLIARTEAMFSLGLDEAIDRCNRAIDVGADMTLCLRLINMEQCIKVAEKVPGWKMYPDITTHNGKPDVDLKEIKKLGFNFVTLHYLERGAMWGMLEYGRHNWANQNNVYADTHDMGGLTPEEQKETIAFNNKKWLQFEADCLNV